MKVSPRQPLETPTFKPWKTSKSEENDPPPLSESWLRAWFLTYLQCSMQKSLISFGISARTSLQTFCFESVTNWTECFCKFMHWNLQTWRHICNKSMLPRVLSVRSQSLAISRNDCANSPYVNKLLLNRNETTSAVWPLQFCSSLLSPQSLSPSHNHCSLIQRRRSPGHGT